MRRKGLARWAMRTSGRCLKDSILANRAMTLLYRRFNPRLVRYLRVADPASYEDLVAEVWLSVSPPFEAFKAGKTTFELGSTPSLVTV